MASRIEPAGAGDVYVQTLIRVQTPGGNYAGGPSTYVLPQSTKQSDQFSITALSGSYPLGTPTEMPG